jgi:hypothetical protein
MFLLDREANVSQNVLLFFRQWALESTHWLPLQINQAARFFPNRLPKLELAPEWRRDLAGRIVLIKHSAHPFLIYPE